MHLRILVTFIFSTCALLVSSAQASISPEPTGAFIGAGMSAGATRIAAPGEQTSVGLSGRARVGLMLSELAGVDLEGTVNLGGQRNLLIGSVTTGFNYFITEGGLYTRAGLGVMHLTKAIDNGREDTGAVIDGGLGYRFLLNHERTASLDARFQYGVMDRDDVTVFGLGIATSWF